MASGSRSAHDMAVAQLVLAGVAFLGWIAIALLAYFQQLPREWPEKQAPLSDIAFALFLLSGPVLLAAGLGFLKNRRWARLLTLGLAIVAALFTITALTLACCSIVPIC